jgi:hypothetical protein
MPFTYKISRRLALAHVALAGGVLSTGCGGDSADLGPAGSDIAGVQILPEAATVQPNQSLRFTSHSRLSDGMTSPDEVGVKWSATGGTISADGVYKAAEAPGTYRVIGTGVAGDFVDTSVVTVSASATPPATGNPNAPDTASAGNGSGNGGGSGSGNEPSDFSQVAKNDLRALNEDGWYVDGGSGYGIVNEASATGGDQGFLRATFRGGEGESTTPVRMQKNIDGAGLTQIYWSYWIKVSSNFQGHPTATNKINFAWMNGAPIFFMSAEGVGNGPLTLTARMQSPAEGREYLRPNQGASGNFSRGSWHRVELLLKANADGGSNGEITAWLDGAKIIAYNDVRFTGAGEDKTWDYLDITPIWGGRWGAIANTMTMDVDQMYASGRR